MATTTDNKSKTIVPSELISKVRAHVEEHMSRYDGSHDYHHILRVVGLCHHLYTALLSLPPTSPPSPPLDLGIITLSALLHDISDRKYLSVDQSSAANTDTNPSTAIQTLLLSLSCPPALAQTIQTICGAVSYSGERKDPSHVQEVLRLHPELAIVQDADRLDALGAIGVARVFTYGAVKNGLDMGVCKENIGKYLYGRETMMKTAEGKRMAEARAERLRIFEGWWEEEEGMEGTGVDILKEKE